MQVYNKVISIYHTNIVGYHSFVQDNIDQNNNKALCIEQTV